MSKFIDTIKLALQKKHAAAHPDQERKETHAQPGRPAVPITKKPQKKVTGRGR